ncbi:huntingtin-interacting protein K [Arctopsyche grandis]|uniref:huntingtin-interacting protein K n=1 Tax=Arctopsyche grandis TaxID=121162 RepID=UPI00406D8CBD
MGSMGVAVSPPNGECGIADEAGDEAPNSGAPQRRQAKHDSGVADLERVTDYAEEKEISSQDILGAISLIRDRRSKETMEKIEREKELCKVTILKEHVDIIVKEMEISRTVAERTLREHHGDVVAALTALTD